MFKQFAKSVTSGSFAALKILVCPCAKTAVINALSVAPTETLGKLITPPLNPSLLRELIIKPLSNLTFAPSASITITCKSIGLLPMAHPPGRGTFAVPFDANKGPNTRIEALICLTKS